MDWRRAIQGPYAVLVALVASNLIPIVGVLVLGWKTGDVMLLYWAESGIIGFFGIVRMASTTGWLAFFLVPFFCFHFGMFMLVHLVFLVVFFIGGGLFGGASVGDVLATVGRVMPAFLALVLSHTVSFVYYFVVKKEGRSGGPAKMMAAPYARVVVLQFTIILAGLPVLFLGEPLFGLVLLVVFKTIVDVASHVATHKGRPWFLVRNKPAEGSGLP